LLALRIHQKRPWPILLSVPPTSLLSHRFSLQVRVRRPESGNAKLMICLGTFLGALIAADCADFFGRRIAILVGCFLFIVGVAIEMAAQTIPVLAAGRVIAGLGVGFESAIVILYMSEIAPKKVRGALVSGYQFCITIGLLLASCVDYSTKDRADSGAYRIPFSIQFLWALILGIGIAFLPESPRYYVKRGKIENAIKSLSKLRGQSPDSEYIQAEISEIIANHEYE
jgi:MFS family permease